MELVSQSVQDTHAIAQKLARRVLTEMPGKAQATVIALRGELGAGKTTFVQGFAQAMGVIERPKSPTFNLAKVYDIPGTAWHLWHLDCYRLNGRDDLASLDMHTAFEDPNNLMLIEWPERIGDALPREHIEVHLTHAGPEQRGVTIT